MSTQALSPMTARFCYRGSRLPVASLTLAVTGIVVLAGCSRGPADVRFLDRGKKLVEKKEYSRALLEFKNAELLKPKSAEPYYQAALAYLGMGDYDRVYANLLRATELD